MKVTCYFLKFLSFLILQPSYGINFDWSKNLKIIASRIGRANIEYEKTNNLKVLELFDFIVVGSGSGGSSVTAGLLDRPNVTVLLLEAGSYNITSYIYPYENSLYLSRSKQVKDLDWGYKTLPEPFMNGKSFQFWAGRGIGGSTLINGLYWVRGHPNDYNNLAIKVKDPAWNYENLLPFFKQTENFTGGDLKYRGNSGPIGVTNEIAKTNMSQNFLNAFQQLGYKIISDYNGKDSFGGCFSQQNIKVIDKRKHIAVRQDSFTTQLNKYLTKNSSLHVLTGASVEKILFNQQKKIQYLLFRRNGKLYKVRAKRDIILSAGVLRTPGILMHSGIGNCEYLKSKNIDCIHNLPGVGKNLQYHLVTPLQFKFKNINEDAFTILFAGNWSLDGLTSPKHLVEIFHLKKRTHKGSGVVLLSYFQSHHRSRGRILVQSNNASEIPLMQLNAFDNVLDIKDHVEGMRLGLAIGKKMSEKFKIKQAMPMPSSNSDHDLFSYAQEQSSLYHCTGTAKMGIDTDIDAVLDTKLRVRGIRGLRVSDLSVLPDVPTGNTNSPANMIGRKCAQLIIDEYFL